MCNQCDEIQEAFEFAVKRYWRHYDSYGPFWRLFGPLIAVVESLDENGSVKPYMSKDFPRIVQEARRRMGSYVEWQKEQEDKTSNREEPMEAFLLIEEELIRLRGVA